MYTQLCSATQSDSKRAHLYPDIAMIFITMILFIILGYNMHYS